MDKEKTYVEFIGDISFPIHYEIDAPESSIADFLKAVENHINVMPSFIEVLDSKTWKKKTVFYHTPSYFNDLMEAAKEISNINYRQIAQKDAKKQKLYVMDVQTFGERLRNSDQIFSE